jgi:hypothetical protein
MHENRLQFIDNRLATILRSASEQDLRRISLEVCEYLLDTLGIDSRTSHSAIQLLREHRYDDDEIIAEVTERVEELDDYQLSLQRQFEQGDVDKSSYLLAFRRARAVNALLEAFTPDPLAASIGVMHEAEPALEEDADDLVRFVQSVLERRR